MPIEFFTGLPGNGKTAFMVEKLIAESKKAERPIVASGIDGLAPGLAMDLPDPRNWNDVDPNGEPVCECNAAPHKHAHKIPDGSLIFVDEAWKWFGHLQDAGRQATPPHVLQLAEHRHRGIDFVWTTQMPSQIFPFARALGSRHTHVVRRFGTHFVDLYTWEELNEDVKSAAKRENATKQARRLPSQVFDQYKSATIHTIKRRIPMKLFVLPVAIALAAASFWYAYQYFKPDSIADRLGNQGTDAALAAAAPGTPGTATGPTVEPMSTAEYIARQQARIPTAPWTAPLYDDRPATVDPALFCMSAGHDGGDACTCLTEQGTQYLVDQAQCVSMARTGPIYNPFRGEEREQSREGFARADHDRGPSSVPSSVSALGIGQKGFPAAYGQFRDEPLGPQKYEAQGW